MAGAGATPVETHPDAFHTYCCLGLVVGQMVNDHNDHTCHIVITSHILHNVNPLI